MRRSNIRWHRLTRPESASSGDGRAGSDREAFYAAAPRAPSPLQRALIVLARNTVLHRGKMRHLMTRLIMLLGGNRPLDVLFRGCVYRIAGRTNLIEYGLLLNPNYNRPDLDFLLDGLKEGDVAVDIGANVGLYSLPLAKAVGASGRVVAIDANPLMIQGLAWNAAASGLYNIALHATPVGAADGRVELYSRSGDAAMVKVEESADGSVAMRSLMAIVDEEALERIDVLKIDIEGYEDKVLVPFLAQARDALLPTRIVIEHIRGEDYPGCKAAFERLGYALIGRTKQNSLYRRN